MKRQIAGLHAADRCGANQIPEGVFLVRVKRAKFTRQVQKPYYTLTLAILEPARFAEQVISSRLSGLTGVVKISHIVLNSAFLVRLDGFAATGRWGELCPENLDSPQVA
jgi:hypothetical protein